MEVAGKTTGGRGYREKREEIRKKHGSMSRPLTQTALLFHVQGREHHIPRLIRISSLINYMYVYATLLPPAKIY
jgi:hypothetical protein